jgi:hypothetical protein
MDIDDVPSASKEFRRVIRPAGQLIISVYHPFVDRGRFASKETNSPFILEGTYFGRRRFDGVAERDGLRMHFAGWSQPLEAYGIALEKAGLAITSLREPVADLDAIDGTRWRVGFACRCSFGERRAQWHSKQRVIERRQIIAR